MIPRPNCAKGTKEPEKNKKYDLYFMKQKASCSKRKGVFFNFF